MSRAIVRSTKALLSRLRKSTRMTPSTTSASGTAPSTAVSLQIRPQDPNNAIFVHQFSNRVDARQSVDFWYGTSRFIDLKEWRRLTNILSEPPK